jgi:hypothetical protein
MVASIVMPGRSPVMCGGGWHGCPASPAGGDPAAIPELPRAAVESPRFRLRFWWRPRRRLDWRHTDELRTSAGGLAIGTSWRRPQPRRRPSGIHRPGHVHRPLAQGNIELYPPNRSISARLSLFGAMAVPRVEDIGRVLSDVSDLRMLRSVRGDAGHSPWLVMRSGARLLHPIHTARLMPPHPAVGV